MVCSGNSDSVSVRVKELQVQVQRRMRELATKSCEHQVRLRKYLFLRKLEGQCASVSWRRCDVVASMAVALSV